MTNPDNVGGLPNELGFEQWYVTNTFDYPSNPLGSRDCSIARKAWHAALEAARDGELCRAAPAGGECSLGVGDGSGQLFVHGSYEAIKACQALIVRDSAPAGSGEVEEYDWDAAHEALESIDDYARMDVGVAPHGPYTVLRDLLTKAKGWQEAAALLRKLQQGAE